MAAPTPRPAALKILTGRSGGRDSSGYRIKPPPTFARSTPEAPGWLDAVGRAEWDRVIAALEPLDMLKAADTSLLAARCEAWSRFVHAVEQYRREGITRINPDSGRLGRHPAVNIAELAAAQMRSLGNEFGLSPAAERLLNMGPRDDDVDDPFA